MNYEIIPAADGDGLAVFRNRAIKNIKAKYVAFCGRDVIFDPDMMDFVTDEMERSGAGMGVIGYDIADPEGGILYETPEGTRRVMDRDDMLCRIFYQTHYQGFVWNKVYRRSIIKRNFLKFDEDIPGSEEMVFLVDYLKHTRDVVVLPQHLVHATAVPTADMDLELLAYERIRKKLRRFPDAQWLCEESMELLEMELSDDYDMEKDPAE